MENIGRKAPTALRAIPSWAKVIQWSGNLAGGAAIGLALLLLALLAPSVWAQTASEQTLVASTPDTLNGMIQASDGNFYAASYQDECTNSTNCGAIYRITPSGTITVLTSFSSASGYNVGALTEGTDGNLYGIAGDGGANAQGTIFKVTLSGQLTVLHSFLGTADGYGDGGGDGGSAPALVGGGDGNLYGTNFFGGSGANGPNTGGTIFKITPSGNFSVLYSFTGSGTDFPEGSEPYGLVQGSDGNFYGGTEGGGANNSGTFYKITPSGNFTLLYSFTGAAFQNGFIGGPAGPFVEASNGNFYGMTAYDTMYQLSSTGTLTPLYGDVDNDLITEGLTLGSDGNLYSNITTSGTACPSTCGTVFQLTPAGNFATIYTFTDAADGADPLGLLAQGSDGKFYVTTSGNSFGGIGGPSGPSSFGTIDSLALSPSLPAPVQLTFNKTSVDPGSSVTLTWKVLNAFSTTMQQCAAFVQGGAAGAGTWTGVQAGELANKVYSGSATITPTADGTYIYALTCGGQESGFATLTVGNGLAVTTTTLPGATAGTTYSATLAATGGTPPYTWVINSGSLPEGLALDASSGTISGTPTTAGTSTFTIQVADSESLPATATGSLSLTVAPAAAPPSFSTTAANNGNITVSSGSTGTLALTTVASSGYTGTVNYSCSPSSTTFTCSVSPTSLAFTADGATTQTATLTINAFLTTSSSLKQLPPPFQNSTSIPIYAAMALWLPGSFLALFGLRRKGHDKHARRLRMLVLLFVGIASAGSLMGCGSIQKLQNAINCAESGGSNCSNNANTLAGNYTVAITSSDGKANSNLTVNVTVQ